MADDRELAGLDPFVLFEGESEGEAGRLDAFLSGLGESGASGMTGSPGPGRGL
jgi:hypothetical protein